MSSDEEKPHTAESHRQQREPLNLLQFGIKGTAAQIEQKVN